MSISHTDFIDLAPVNLTPVYESGSLRAVAIINGARYSIVSAKVELNAHGFTNSATVVLPIQGNPDFSLLLGDAATASKYNESTSVYIELWAGIFESPQYGDLDTRGMMRLFLGVIDEYEPTFQENIVTFTCRSVVADLADTKISKNTFAEPAATTFLQAQAAIAGIRAVSPSPALARPITLQEVLGKELVGGSAFGTALFRKSVADLLIQAATFDDCDVWVEDDTIYYQQARNVQRGAPIQLTHGRDFSMRGGIVGTHALRQSKNIRVDVHSFQPRVRTASRSRVVLTVDADGNVMTSKTAASVSTSTSVPIYGTSSLLTTTKTATGTSTVLATTGGGTVVASSSPAAAENPNVEKFNFYVRNQSLDACNKLAVAIARQIASMEYRLTFGFAMKRALVGVLRIISVFRISGLPYSRFNDEFWARRITHTLSVEDGWQVEVSAVNHQMLSGEFE